jgi:hypothetical protein
VDIHRKNPDTVRDPSKQSLYEFVRRYSNNWKLHGEDKVPHVIPSFRSVPKRGVQNKERYPMFLRALLLMHKPGSTWARMGENAQHPTLLTERCPDTIANQRGGTRQPPGFLSSRGVQQRKNIMIPGTEYL